MPYSIDEIQRIAERAAASKMFRGTVKDSYLTVDQAFILVLKGVELGLPATTALGMSLIGGKPVLDVASMNTLLGKHGYGVVMVDLSDDACTLELQREGEALPSTRTTFTYDEAQKADLPNRPGTGKNWTLWRQDMLYARCVSRMVRRHAPGIFGGAVYAPGEIGEEGAPAASERDIPDMTRPVQAGQAPARMVADPTRIVADMDMLAQSKGYSAAHWELWVQNACAKLGVSTLAEAPIENLQRLATLVEHWPVRDTRRPLTIVQEPVDDPDDIDDTPIARATRDEVIAAGDGLPY